MYEPETIAHIKALCKDDMNAVDVIIRQRLRSEVALVSELSSYIINSGGKRLRPLLALIAAKALGFEGIQHQLIATIIEFIHTATLLHDDVVDDSHLRRGKKTANELWGNAASVLVGDFLYSRAFEMMVEVNDLRVMEILAHTTNVIAEGEVLQLMNCNDPDTTEEQYLEVIHCKTSKLFEAATLLGAVLCSSPIESQKAIAAYGMHLGTAFQLIDDVLDYRSSAQELGKNVGDDLAEGKPTLPLIYAMRVGNPKQVEVIRNAIIKGGFEHIDEVQDILQLTGAIAYTEQIARHESEQAIINLEFLPDTEYRHALHQLAQYSIERKS